MVLVTFLVEDSATIRNNLIPTLADLGGAGVVAFAEGEKDAVRHGAQVADTVGGAHVVERGGTSPDVHDVPGHLDGA